MQVKRIAEGEHSAILSTFIKLPFVIKIFVLSIFKWPFNTVFAVICFMSPHNLLVISVFKLEPILVKIYLLTVFVVKMPFTYHVCSIYSNPLQDTFTMEANSLSLYSLQYWLPKYNSRNESRPQWS